MSARVAGTREIADRIREHVRHNTQSAFERVIGGPGAQKGSEYYYHCVLPGHADGIASLRISFDKAEWFCDPCNTGGDIFNLYAAKIGSDTKSDFRYVAVELAKFLGLSLNGAKPKSSGKGKSKDRDDGEIVWPVPGHMLDQYGRPKPMPGVASKYRPAPDLYPYRNAGGALLMFTARLELADGSGKDVMPLTLRKMKSGVLKWRWKGPSKERPLYGLDRLAANPHRSALILEGEKCYDAAANFPLT
jgi:hypothetical protein